MHAEEALATHPFPFLVFVQVKISGNIVVINECGVRAVPFVVVPE